jgi:hypothetical protein
MLLRPATLVKLVILVKYKEDRRPRILGNVARVIISGIA